MVGTWTFSRTSGVGVGGSGVVVGGKGVGEGDGVALGGGDLQAARHANRMNVNSQDLTSWQPTVALNLSGLNVIHHEGSNEIFIYHLLMLRFEGLRAVEPGQDLVSFHAGGF